MAGTEVAWMGRNTGIGRRPGKRRAKNQKSITETSATAASIAAAKVRLEAEALLAFANPPAPEAEAAKQRTLNSGWCQNIHDSAGSSPGSSQCSQTTAEATTAPGMIFFGVGSGFGHTLSGVQLTHFSELRSTGARSWPMP